MADGIGDKGSTREASATDLAASKPANRDEDAAKPAVIRAHIEETRERMSGTIQEIGARLNPRHLATEVKQTIRDATVGKVENMARSTADRVTESGRGIMESIRENPVPAAMVGVGVGWLIVNSRSERTARRPRRFSSEEAGGYLGGDQGFPAKTDRSAGSPLRMGAEDEPGALEHARARASAVVGDVQDKAGALAGQAQEVVSRTAHRAQDMASSVADETRYQAQRIEDRFYENPLAVGVVTLAVGIATGLAMPPTRTESDLVGGARDKFVDKARAALGDTKEKVQHVAERVIEGAQQTASQVAREEGLTS